MQNIWKFMRFGMFLGGLSGRLETIFGVLERSWAVSDPRELS